MQDLIASKNELCQVASDLPFLRVRSLFGELVDMALQVAALKEVLDMTYTQQQTALADYAHEAWSGWMRYLFDRSTLNEDGTVTIPKLSVERWQRQINTPFSGLPSEEQKSDYAEAERIERAMQQNGEWSDAHLFALREQMRAAGIRCETVAEGVAFLLKLFEAQGETKGWQSSRFAADAGAN